jgi:hypothetical protein
MDIGELRYTKESAKGVGCCFSTPPIYLMSRWLNAGEAGLCRRWPLLRLHQRQLHRWIQVRPRTPNATWARGLLVITWYANRVEGLSPRRTRLVTRCQAGGPRRRRGAVRAALMRAALLFAHAPHMLRSDWPSVYLVGCLKPDPPLEDKERKVDC